MAQKTYHMTATAETHFWNALRESKQKWGRKRAEKYRIDFLAGLQHIADNHQTFNSPHRTTMAEGTAFSIHLVEHRYVAFQTYGNDVIIAGIFHEHMDVPARLNELQNMSQAEIDAIRAIVGD